MKLLPLLGLCYGRTLYQTVDLQTGEEKWEIETEKVEFEMLTGKWDDQSREPRGQISSPMYGGGGGSYFSDESSFKRNGYPTQIRMNCGANVDSISIKYGSIWGSQHGGSGGSSIGSSVARGISSAQGKAGSRIDQLNFKYSGGGGSGNCGGSGGTSFSAQAPATYQMGYINGRADNRVDAIQFVW